MYPDAVVCFEVPVRTSFFPFAQIQTSSASRWDAFDHLMNHVGHVIPRNKIGDVAWQREVVHGMLFKGNMIMFHKRIVLLSVIVVRVTLFYQKKGRFFYF
ncbi:hypothetical protein M493_18065 [Geobacillus genomosp. 3]|uniref:Uncharacterized protein n=1 Tax=Geobacillus genomosp. 3 TaxID=1921421 RepID=S5Z466_GEOG3|nr:hypothetical protein M493_18065 [Geobacillus genomosp. 3]